MTHLHHSGHITLADGSILRLDMEMQRWRASWYRADLSVKASAWGPRAEMEAVVNAWSDLGGAA